MKTLTAIRRILAVAVGIWALGVAVFYIFFARISYETTTASAANGALVVSQTTSGQIPWITQAGIYPVVVMVCFSFLLVAVAIFQWRGLLIAAIPLTLLALVVTYITGFSIGGLYFPGAAAGFVGILILSAEKITNRQNHPIL